MITASIVDNFNRADENPLSGGGNWTTPMWSGESVFRVITNLAQGTGTWNNAYWNTETFQNVQAAVKFLTTGTRYYYLYVRMQEVGTTAPHGYSVAIGYNEGSMSVKKHPEGGGSSINIDSASGITFASGNRIGIVVDGSNLYGLLDQGSGWETMCQGTDTTFPDAGYVGIECYGGAYMDDFIVGSYGTQPTSNKILSIIEGV